MQTRFASTYRPHAQGQINRGYIWLVSLSSLVMMSLVSGFLFSRWSDSLGLPGAITIAATAIVSVTTFGAVYIWGNGINYRIRERRSESWQWDIPIGRTGPHTSRRDVARIRYTLKHRQVSDKSPLQVLLVTKLHWFYLLHKVAAWILATLAIISALAYQSTIDTLRFRTWPLFSDKPKTYEFDGGGLITTLLILALLASLAIVGAKTLTYLRHYVIVTNHSVIVAFVYPVWLPVLRSDVRPLRVSLIKNDAYKVDTNVGGLLGYGSVDLSTYLQDSEDRFFRLRFVPDHAAVCELIGSIRPSEADTGL